MRREFLTSGTPLTRSRAPLPHGRHAHALPAGFSRRTFMQGAAGAAALGAVAGATILTPGSASAIGPGLGNVVPIPATLDFFGVLSHVQAPPLTGADTDPATVFNFEGAAGIGFVTGNCTRHNRRTGVTESLPYIFNDMRFMKGVYRGRDGHVRGATFALV